MGLFDALTAAILVLLAWRCLVVPDLFRSLVLFIVFGLLLALTWARLDAPDLALAEAAIGAGVLGVLLMGTWRALGSPREAPPAGSVDAWWIRVLAALGATALSVAVALGLHLLPGGEQSAGAEITARLPLPATEQPVTAVLLDFRSYDTLLEMAVLFMAVIGTYLAGAPLLDGARHAEITRGTPVMAMIVRVFLPVLLVVGAYLVWAGAYTPGGAFQGGAVLAGAGILLVLGHRLAGAAPTGTVLAILLALGLLVFIGAGLALLFAQGAFMAYPQSSAKLIMLVVEYALALSIALSLLLLFTGSEGLRRRDR